MAKRQRLEEQLARLDGIRDAPAVDAAGLALLAASLQAGHNAVVAKAARIAGNRGLAGLTESVAAQFSRFMERPTKSDPGCRAKTAIVRALNALDWDDAAVFRQAIGHVQREPVYGGTVDTAAELRGASVFGLVRIGVPEALWEATSLLADEEPQARIAAVRALTWSASEAAELVLRLKALTGDADADVLGDCFSGLLAISVARSVPLVAGFLEARDREIAELAALALGESGTEAGLAALLTAWERELRVSGRAWLALPIALTRRQAARDFLLAQVGDGAALLAAAAVEAMRIYRADGAWVERIRSAVWSRDEAVVSRMFAATFEA